MGNLEPCRKKYQSHTDFETPEKEEIIVELNNSSSGNSMPQTSDLKKKLIKIPENVWKGDANEEEKNPRNEFNKDLLKSNDFENIFKSGLDRQILQFYTRFPDKYPKFCITFQLYEDLKKSRMLESRNHEEEDEEEEEKVFSPFKNEEAHEGKKKELLFVEIDKAEEERDGNVCKNDEKINQVLQETHGN